MASGRDGDARGVWSISGRIDRDDERAVIVVVASDAGWKYLSTGVWTDDLDEATANVEGIVYF